MKRLVIRLGLSALGVVATLLWWTYHDKGSSAHSMSHIPAKVGDGGNRLEISVEASTPSTMRVSFDDLRKPAGEQILIDSWEKIPAGAHTWAVDVPSGIGGYIELGADNPNPGDTLTQRVKVNGKAVDEQTDRLEGRLQPNTAFFVQFHADDFSGSAEPSIQ